MPYYDFIFGAQGPGVDPKLGRHNYRASSMHVVNQRSTRSWTDWTDHFKVMWEHHVYQEPEINISWTLVAGSGGATLSLEGGNGPSSFFFFINII